MIDPKRLALAGGILWGIGVFVITLVSVYTGYGKAFLDCLISIYPGFQVTIGGSIIGAIYGFLDAFVGLYVFAWLYNYLGRSKG